MVFPAAVNLLVFCYHTYNMFYRLVTFKLGVNKLDAAKSIFADLAPKISSQKGCEGVKCFGDAESGKYGFSVLWESAQASEDAKSIIGPLLSKHLAENNASDNPFSTELFKVIEY
jgi:hypothetical protein